MGASTVTETLVPPVVDGFTVEDTAPDADAMTECTKINLCQIQTSIKRVLLFIKVSRFTGFSFYSTAA